MHKDTILTIQLISRLREIRFLSIIIRFSMNITQPKHMLFWIFPVYYKHIRGFIEQFSRITFPNSKYGYPYDVKIRKLQRLFRITSRFFHRYHRYFGSYSALMCTISANIEMKVFGNERMNCTNGNKTPQAPCIFDSKLKWKGVFFNENVFYYLNICLRTHYTHTLFFAPLVSH